MVLFPLPLLSSSRWLPYVAVVVAAAVIVVGGAVVGFAADVLLFLLIQI